MTINKRDLSEMNDLQKKGQTIAEIAEKYPKYEYREIYLNVNDASFLGIKRTITNRLKKLVNAKTPSEREALVDDAQQELNKLYGYLKDNSKRLIEIDRILRK